MKPILKILHLEDSPSDAYLIERALRKAHFDFIIHIAETKQQFIEALENFKPDLILSDHSLPQFNSMDALTIYKQYNYEVPFILITGSVSEEFATRSIKEGADDYILKNNLIRLPSAIRQALRARQIESEKHRANLELESINKELSTFIYKAAHDLRGPLCSIMGLINVAGMQKDPASLPEYLQKISESTNKLDSILLSLMEVMSIKNAMPAVREIDFKKLVNGTLERLKTLETYSGVEFIVDIRNEGGFFSDEAMINAILYNITENALNFSNRNNPKSHVIVRIYNIENGVEIKIEDNGIGMNEEVQDKIFEMYYKGNQFSKNTGLGLYVAGNAIKKLGGVVDVKSTPGAGTTFTITLPAFLVHMS